MSTRKHSVRNEGRGRERKVELHDLAWDLLREWDAEWTESYQRVADNPRTNGILSIKQIELICVAINIACTNLNAAGIRRYIRAALGAGATREELVELIKMGAGLAIHSCSLGAPILLEEAKAAGARPAGRGRDAPTPFCDQMRRIGQWNSAGTRSSRARPPRSGPISSSLSEPRSTRKASSLRSSSSS